LHTLYSFSSGNQIIVVSGHSEHLTDDEKSRLFSCFDEIVSLEITHVRKNKILYLVQGAGEVGTSDVVLYTSKKGVGGKLVGAPPFTPHRLDFEIFEAMASDIEQGHDILLDCVPYLIHYHGIRKIYIWIKALIDFASVFGRKLYVLTSGLSENYIDILKNLADVSTISKHVKYEDIGESSAIKFYDSILGFLDYNSKKKLIVMLLEDLHWADKSSLELLLYISRNISNSRIFILATYRGYDIVNDDEAAEILEDIQALENTDLIRLRNLSRDSLAKLLRSIRSEVGEEDIEKIYEKSEGNPLLAISIVEQFGNDKIRVPETIRESVEIQLENLDDRTLHFLTVLAVIGDIIPTKIVKSIYPKWKERIKKIEGKFVEVEDGTIQFTYSVYREIIYSITSKDTRTEIHKKIAQIYEAHHDVVKAASHYYLSGDIKALKLLGIAADESIKNFAIRDAVDYCKMALDLAKRYRLNNDISRIYEKTGDFYRMSGEYQKAIEMYESSLNYGNPKLVSIGTKIGECYERLGKYDKALLILTKYHKLAKGLERGRITGKIGIVKWHLGDFEEAKTYLEEYLKVARKYKSSEDEAEAYRNIAIIFIYYSKYDEALEYAKKALDKAIESVRYDIIANSYNVIGVIYNHKNLIDNALDYFQKYLEIAEKIGNYDYISKAYNNLALIYDYKGDFEKAKNYYLLSLELNYKLGNKRDLAISYNNLAVIESENGDSLKAIEYLKKSLKYAEEIGDTYNMCSGYRNLSSFYFDIKYYSEAKKALDSAIKIAESESYFSLLVNIYSMMVDICRETGKLKEASKYLALAEKYLEKSEDKYDKLTYMETKIIYLLELGKINEAEDLLEEAIKIAMELNDENELNILDEARARIRCARKDYSNAQIYFERVIEYAKNKNKKRSIGEAYRYYAECLEKFQKDEARKYYQYAYTLYKSLNNQRWAAEIEERLRKL